MWRSVLIVLFLILPLAVAAAFLILVFRGARQGLLIAALFFCITIAAGYWSIAQSRSSTAGIGFLFLPGYGAIAAVLAWVFARFGHDVNKRISAAGWLCLLASLAFPVALIYGGIRLQQKNRARDREQAENLRRIGQNTATIRQLLRENPGSETAALETEIAKHPADRTFLIPALGTEFVSEATLERFSRSPDFGVVLEVARNQRTPSATLAWIYRSSSYPPLFFQALAENKNTNQEILRKLYEHPEPQGPLGRSLSNNPSVPRDILEKLADSPDPYTLQGLLRNPALDCPLLRKVQRSAAQATRQDYLRSTIATLELRLCSAK